MPTFRCVFLFSVTDEEWEIDKSELTLLRELGSGQFGVRLSKESAETIRQNYPTHPPHAFTHTHTHQFGNKAVCPGSAGR